MAEQHTYWHELALALAAAALVAGVAMHYQRTAPETIPLLSSRLAAHPEDLRTRERLAALLRDARRTDDAVAQYRDLLRRDPGNPRYLLNLADLLAGAHGAEAESLYRAVLEKAPESSPATVGLARLIAAHPNGSPEAQDLLDRFLRAHPDDPPANELLGDLLVQSLHEVAYPAAQKYYERALSGDPYLASAALGLSQIYLRQGRLQDAGNVLQRPAARDRKTSALHLQYAEVLSALGRRGEASTEYNTATALDPTNVDALCRWAMLLIDTAHYPEAESVLRMALEREPKNAELHVQLGRALREDGRSFRAAMDEFATALDCDNRYVPAYMELAETHLKLNQQATAENFLRRAMEAGPADTRPKLRLAALLMNPADPARANLPEALVLLAQAVGETQSKDLSVLVAYADALARTRQYDLAEEQVDIALGVARQVRLSPLLMETLLERRQTLRMAQMPTPEGPGSPLDLAPPDLLEPMGTPWPMPTQPSMVDMVKLFPVDVEHPPRPGSAFDLRLYIVAPRPGSGATFMGMPVLDVLK